MSIPGSHSPLGEQTWLIVLPPEGGARMVGENIAEAFEKVPSVTSHTFDSGRYLTYFESQLKAPESELAVDLLNQSLIVKALDCSPTHILVMALAPVTVFALRLLRKQGMRTLHWFVEDYRQARYWKDVLPGYDDFLAIQEGPIPDACRIAGARFRYFPNAATCSNRSPIPLAQRPFDVAFIGIPSPYRVEALESLWHTGLSVAIAGSGWESYRGPLVPCIRHRGWADIGIVQELLGNSKVGLNLSFHWATENQASTQLSPRVFDIVERSCLLVSEKCDILPRTLPDISYFGFDKIEGLIAAVKQALEQALEGAISQNYVDQNRRLILDGHSYRARVAELLEI